MKCNHFVVTSLSSTHSQSNDDDDVAQPYITANATGAAASCRGDYKSGFLRGTVAATIRNKPTGEPFAMTMTISSTYYDDSDRRYKMAVGANVTFCESEMEVPADELVFSGSATAKIIDLFSGSVANAISSSLDEQLCALLKPPLESGVTKWIRVANNVMIDLIGNDATNATTAPSNDDAPSFLDWDDDIPLLRNGLAWGNKFVNNHWHEGIARRFVNSLFHNLRIWNARRTEDGWVPEDEDVGFVMAPPLERTTRETHIDDEETSLSLSSSSSCDAVGFFHDGWNGLVHSLTNGTGTYRHSFPRNGHNASVLFPGYGTVSVRVDSVTVTGIDSFENVTAFLPLGRRSVRSRVASEVGFDVELGLGLR
eukprot:CAMPEP_0172487876 /NCGR_PEP_ID=MMETSP1066-20121228/17153_1 /TAXON_ID=671091 /ORGANISM="Coscinodiscus wailesii, Strain CCMP2513" /LENGTH=367 /DNA_ID=CAMNT_0013254757 /DNA_START=14 /DNA_END=1113 /DNA_ORIENTATION=-